MKAKEKAKEKEYCIRTPDSYVPCPVWLATWFARQEGYELTDVVGGRDYLTIELKDGMIGQLVERQEWMTEKTI